MKKVANIVEFTTSITITFLVLDTSDSQEEMEYDQPGGSQNAELGLNTNRITRRLNFFSSDDDNISIDGEENKGNDENNVLINRLFDSKGSRNDSQNAELGALIDVQQKGSTNKSKTLKRKYPHFIENYEEGLNTLKKVKTTDGNNIQETQMIVRIPVNFMKRTLNTLINVFAGSFDKLNVGLFTQVGKEIRE